MLAEGLDYDTECCADDHLTQTADFDGPRVKKLKSLHHVCQRKTLRHCLCGHVDGALNLPLDRFVHDYASVAPDKSKQIVLHCHSGARSGQAMQFLRQQNYENVFNGGSVGEVALKTSRPIHRL